MGQHVHHIDFEKDSRKKWASFCRWLFSIIKGDLQKKRSSPSVLTEDASLQYHSRMAALVMMASMGRGSFVQQG